MLKIGLVVKNPHFNCCIVSVLVCSNWRLKAQIFEFKNRIPKFINSNIQVYFVIEIDTFCNIMLCEYVFCFDCKCFKSCFGYLVFTLFYYCNKCSIYKSFNITLIYFRILSFIFRKTYKKSKNIKCSIANSQLRYLLRHTVYFK